MNLRDLKISNDAAWKIPPWGHPLGKCVMPLLISAEERLIPIGTAFVLSRKTVLVVTAWHNANEAVKRCWRHHRLATCDDLSGSYALSAGVCIWVLYHHLHPSGDVQLLLWPLETIHGPQPTDVVLGVPKAAPGLPTVSCDVSFEVPDPGTLVQCVGYTNFKYPGNGICLDAARKGTFDWATQYSHEFWVHEGPVRYLFTQAFSAGYIRGPCFSVGTEIPHGLSGGPVFNTETGSICGVNSAGATSFFAEPTSLASPLFPILTSHVEISLSEGPVRLTSTLPVAELVGRGHIKSRGSERAVYFYNDSDGAQRVGVQTRDKGKAWVYDDYASFQSGVAATVEHRPIYRIRARRKDCED